MKLKAFITLLFVICPMLVVGQNLLHYAFSANGEKGECLFPEKDGKIIFSEIIETPHSSHDISEAVNNYVLGLSANENTTIETVLKSDSKCVYKIKFGIGKQALGVEFWGSPVFTTVKDASVVNFRCIVDILNGKYKYTLDDFITNRNTIRGEAKNDGQSNTIHWQRVNSLLRERENYIAENDTTKRDVKEDIYDYNSQLIYENYLYIQEYNAVRLFINGLTSLNINNDSFNEPGEISKEGLIIPENATNILGMSNFSLGTSGMFNQPINDNRSEQSNYIQSQRATKGFLLSKNNNVFIDSGEPLYEQAGAQELIKQNIIDGFWNVVNSRSQADFVITYKVNLEGRDKAYLTISTPDGSVTYDKFPNNTTGASESASENREVARSLYLNCLQKIQKKVEKGDNSLIKQFKDLYIQ